MKTIIDSVIAIIFIGLIITIVVLGNQIIDSIK